MNRHRALVVLTVMIGSAVAAAEKGPDRTVAVTFDDLPFVGSEATLEQIDGSTDAILAALGKHRAPASGFVTGARVMVAGETGKRLDLLRQWRDAGVKLENHGYGHISLQRTPVRDYLDDLIQGQLFPETIMAEAGGKSLWFRPPFNHTGASTEARKELLVFLEERGLRLAPFTVEHADYLFNDLYTNASERGDRDTMRRTGDAYLYQIDAAFGFAEKISRETFGREIPQVFLIHANLINAVYLDGMLERIRGRGYRFISLDEAVADRAYETPEEYVGPAGISWFHRWRVGLELEDKLREEPDPPAWVLEDYRALQKARQDASED